MPTCLEKCADLLASAGIRHHVDDEEQVIRLAFVTRHYRNLRGERLAIVRVETPDHGHRCRVVLGRAFPIDPDPDAVCELLCRLAADMPLVGVEFDAQNSDLRLVAEMPVEDGSLCSSQLCAMLDGIIAAAEAWHVAVGHRGHARHSDVA